MRSAVAAARVEQLLLLRYDGRRGAHARAEEVEKSNNGAVVTHEERGRRRAVRQQQQLQFLLRHPFPGLWYVIAVVSGTTAAAV